VSTWIEVAAVLTEEQVVADVEGLSTQDRKPAALRMSPAPVALLTSHMTGKLRFIKLVSTYEVENGEVFMAREWLESIHSQK
jgi:hypothetical protein